MAQHAGPTSACDHQGVLVSHHVTVLRIVQCKYGLSRLLNYHCNGTWRFVTTPGQTGL